MRELICPVHCVDNSRYVMIQLNNFKRQCFSLVEVSSLFPFFKKKKLCVIFFSYALFFLFFVFWPLSILEVDTENSMVCLLLLGSNSHIYVYRFYLEDPMFLGGELS